MTDNKKIIQHIKKLQGQLNSVCLELEKSDVNCIKTSDTLFAASRSFASVRQEFIKCFLEKDFVDNKKVSKEEQKYKSLLNIIKG